MASPRPQKCRHCAKQSATDRTTPCRSCLLENGTLNLTDQTAPLPFKADRLQLRDMAFNSPNSEWKLSAQR